MWGEWAATGQLGESLFTAQKSSTRPQAARATVVVYRVRTFLNKNLSIKNIVRLDKSLRYLKMLGEPHHDNGFVNIFVSVESTVLFGETTPPPASIITYNDY